jgi:hypothetical protein
MKTLTILALGLGLAAIPLAHADDSQQSNTDNMPGKQQNIGGGTTKTPADSSRMDNTPGMKHDMAGNPQAGMKMPDANKKDDMSSRAGMGKMGGMDEMGIKQGAV